MQACSQAGKLPRRVADGTEVFGGAAQGLTNSDSGVGDGKSAASISVEGLGLVDGDQGSRRLQSIRTF